MTLWAKLQPASFDVRVLHVETKLEVSGAKLKVGEHEYDHPVMREDEYAMKSLEALRIDIGAVVDLETWKLLDDNLKIVTLFVFESIFMPEVG